MKATAKLQELGQSLWLDNLTREMLDSGQLQRYIVEFSVTGLTSNPSIFDQAIASGAYDDGIQHKAAKAAGAETLFKPKPRECEDEVIRIVRTHEERE